MIRFATVAALLLFTNSLTAQVVQSLEHDTMRGFENSMIEVAPGIYALAYNGPSEDGYIKTFSISSDGSAITLVDTLLHRNAAGTSFFEGWLNSFIKIGANTFALAYSTDSNAGIIKTFSINSDGTNITEIHSSQFSAGGFYLSFVHLVGNTYVVAYSGSANNGFITSVTITPDGTTITNTETLEHDTQNGERNSLVKIDDNTVALAYSSTNQAGTIKTFDIASNGTGITQVASSEHATASFANSIVHVAGDIYALSFDAITSQILRTFDIGTDGTISTHLASLMHHTYPFSGNRRFPSLIQVDTDSYAVAFTGEDLDGFIETFTISSDGLSIVEVDSLEHDTINGTHNSLVMVDTGTYALAYTGGDDDGFIKTFTIAPDGSLPVDLQSFDVE